MMLKGYGMFSFTPYLLPFILSAITVLAVGLVTWRLAYRNTAAIFMLAVLGCLEIWTVGFIFEIAANGLDAKLILANIQFIGIDTLPVAWLALTLTYTGHFQEWSRFIGALLIIPALNQVIIWTDPFHHLFRQHPSLDTTTASFPILINDYSTWYYFIQMPFATIIFIATSVLLIFMLRSSSKTHRQQILLLLLSTVMPLVLNGLYVLGASPIPHLNLSTVAFAISGVLLGWSLVRFRFLDLMPAARGVLVDSLKDAWIVLDRSGRFVDLNQTAQEIVGQPKQKVIGQYVEKVLSQKPQLVECLQTETDTQQDIALEIAGKARYYDLSLTPLQDKRGGVSGRLMVLRDITQRKQTEEELQRAKEQAEVANRAKSAFLATMSHEIRTPLNGIIGMTSLLQDTPLNQEQSEYLRTILESSDALLNIINDILDFSKIEAGRIDLENRPFELREALESAFDLVSNKARSKGLELTYLMEEPTPVTIQGDLTRLRQILLNLLSNAIKFTENGEVSVTVSSKRLEEAKNGPEDTPNRYELHFAVRDTGIGIAPDNIKRLFHSFSQVDSSTTRKYGGTGLGLAISRRLTELMGGTIWVESQQGVGSTFYFTIQAQEALTTPDKTLRHRQLQLQDKRVLIVDDNATNRKVLSLQVKSWGMLPHECATGKQALALLETGQAEFDLALLDMQMPEIDGIMLAEAIHARPATQNLPLVLLTSLNQRENFSENHFVTLLYKPVKASQLYNTLVQVFREQILENLPTEKEPSHFDSQLGQHYPLDILLAEDNAVNQVLALRVLERMGYQADLVQTGLEVLQALRRKKYDLVLMDVLMPEMDGLEASRIICREWPEETRPRLIAMTANAMLGDREMCLEAGMNDYLSKPIQMQELQAALERAGKWTKQRALVTPAEIEPPTETHLSAPENKNGKGPHPEISSTPPNGQSHAPEPLNDKANQALNPEWLEELREAFGSDASETLHWMAQTYQETAPGLLNQLRTAVAEFQTEQIRAVAHNLKGSSGNLGATHMATLSNQLELIAISGNLDPAAGQLIAQMEEEYKRVCQALDQL